MGYSFDEAIHRYPVELGDRCNMHTPSFFIALNGNEKLMRKTTERKMRTAGRKYALSSREPPRESVADKSIGSITPVKFEGTFVNIIHTMVLNSMSQLRSLKLTLAQGSNAPATNPDDQALRSAVIRFIGRVEADQAAIRLIPWNASWDVGLSTIDRHHRGFLEGINDLFAELMRGESGGALPRMMEQIALFVEPHFMEEEDEMRRLSYPGLGSHVQAHQEFLTGFRQFSRAFQGGEMSIAPRFFDFVAPWFRQHMAVHDGPLSKFLLSNRQVST